MKFRMIFKFLIPAMFMLLVMTESKAIEMEAVANGFNGYVIDGESKETLVGATVRVQGTRYGAITNKSGYYVITNLPDGKYKITVSFIGYDAYEKEIELSKNQARRIDFELKPLSVTTSDITVTADRDVERREITISKVNVPVSQIKQIRIGGETDIFRSLQYLPGILTSSQISSGLFVRGGSPDQNLVLLDGSTVYNPTHLFGFISTFNTDAIKDVELIKGGFPAEYGGRLSAVLNLTQKDGNQQKVGGLASIGALSSRASVEGPSPFGNGSWYVGARRTYLELLKSFIEDDPEEPLPDFNFYDVNMKFAQTLGENDKIFISGFISADALDYDAFGLNMGLDISNKLASMRWTHIFSPTLFSVVNLSASNYTNIFAGDQSGYEFLVDNSITDYTTKATLEWFTSDNITTKFGYEGNYYTFKYLQNFTGNTDSTNQADDGTTTNMKINDASHNLFAQMNYQFTDLISIQAGLRASYWDLPNSMTFDPRLAVRWQFIPEVAVKAAWGIFHQNLRLATQPDFSFFDTWLPTDSTVPITRGEHYILSFETTPFEGYDLNFDVYYKKMDNINELNRFALKGDVVSDLFYVGKGEAYGAEVFLQKKFGKLTGWMGYAIGYIFAEFDEINNGNRFRPKYDRRHDFKAVAQYQINDRWNVGGSFTFQSGQSYTGATSRFQVRLPGQNQGRGKIVPSERYGLRLPPSHQLNVNASYAFKTFGLDSKIILDIYNVYNRRDIWFRYYDTRQDDTPVEDIKLLPIIPTFSYEIYF